MVPRNIIFALVSIVAILSIFYNLSYLFDTAAMTLEMMKSEAKCPTVEPVVQVKEVKTSLPTYKDERFHLYSQCFYTAFYHTPEIGVWDKMVPTMTHCSSLIPLKTDAMTPYQNDDEIKYHMDPIDAGQLKDCHIITLGIGHDVHVEARLKEKFGSNCKFQGADPITKVNEDIYKPIGDYFPFAVGNESRIEATSVKEDPNSQAYTYRNFTHVELVEFLKDRAQVPKDQVIDQLLVDIEYAEFSMTDYFYLNDKLDQAGYTVCQWNGEFHHPNDNQKTEFGKFIKRITKDEQYLFFHLVHSHHIRLFFLNVADERCFNRYVNGRV